MRALKALLTILVLITPLSCGDHEGGIPRSQKTKKHALPDAGNEQPSLADAGTTDAAPATDAAITDKEPDAEVDAEVDAAIEPVTPIDGGLLDASLPDPDPPDAAPVAKTAVAADTIASRSLQAGQELLVLCLLQDEAQKSYVPAQSEVAILEVTPADAVLVHADGTVVAVRTGDIGVSCSFPTIGITDATPAKVRVVPGSPAKTTATVDRDAIVAGESVKISCQTQDPWGNDIPTAAPRLRSDPPESSNKFQGTVGTFGRAGSFELHCDLDGAVSAPARLTVTPGLPAALTVTLVPNKASYAPREVIQLNRIVADGFGNPVTLASVPVTSSPPGTGQGEGRFSYAKSGRYLLTASVAPPTAGGVELSKTAEVLVDGIGPQLNCDSPEDGDLVQLSPETSITLRGAAADPSGIAELRVNGVPTAVDAAGHFESSLTTHFGINFVDLVAVDRSGNASQRNCAFLQSDRWASDSSPYPDTLSLRLRQPAIDDSVRSDLDSLGDILHRVLGSNGLRDSINRAMAEQRVIKSGCDQAILGTCVLSSQVTYVDCAIAGPNQVHLSLTEGGMAATIRIENLGVELLLQGQALNAGYSNQGFVNFESIDVDTIFDVMVDGGRPRVAVRSGSTSTVVGRVSTDFSGIEGEVANIVITLANNIIREYVAMRVQAFVTDDLNRILDGVVAGLDVSSLGKSLSVARLDGTGTIPLDFTTQFSSSSTTSSRMLLGLGTRFSAPFANARPSLGVPLSSSSCLLDVGGQASVGVAIHELVLGQGLHALWRAGYFDATLTSANASLGLPEGMQVKFATQLPPVARIQGARVELALGSVSATLAYPIFLATPIPMTIGAKASMSPHLVGDSLVFDDFRLDELHLSVDAPDLDPFTRAAVEGSVPSMLEFVIGNALRDSLPALPVPSFALPSSLSSYGISPGSRWGIEAPLLSVEAPHFALRGESSIR